MNSAFAKHERIVGKLANTLEERGYSVLSDPAETDIPFSLEGYIPDLVAKKPNDNLIVEVKIRDSPEQALRYRRVVELVESHPGWRFLIQTVSDLSQPERTPTEAPLDVDSIREYFEKVSHVFELGSPELAFPYIWNSIVGLLRVDALQEGLPFEGLTDRSLVNQFYSLGGISNADHERLLRWNRLRNEVVHSTNPKIEPETVTEAAKFVKDLLGKLDSKKSGN